eukprot:11164635-Lingulodinium_polyedra.AAC.1
MQVNADAHLEEGEAHWWHSPTPANRWSGIGTDSCRSTNSGTTAAGPLAGYDSRGHRATSHHRQMQGPSSAARALGVNTV